MEKKDLKTGVVVETRNGRKFIVIMQANLSDKTKNIILNNDYVSFLEYYKNDLTYNCDGFVDCDIVKVYLAENANIFFSIEKDNALNLIWERKEEKQPPQLTERERAYLKAYSYDYEWIARDDDDCLTFFKEKPVKKTNGWYIGYIFKTDTLCIKDLFSFIKWEDEEPYRIKDLLGDKEQ